MKEAAAANRRQPPPPPPPPRFYNFNPTSGIATTTSNDSSSNNHSCTSHVNIMSKSYSDDLSVLSPNLKSYLQTTTTTHNNRADDRNDLTNYRHHDHSNTVMVGNSNNYHHQGSDGVAVSPSLLTKNNNNKKEEEVYSPHLDALSSPTPFTYTTNYNNNNNNVHYHNDDGGGDGLLHSIFSAKKQRKQKRSTTRRRGRRNTKINNNNNEQQEEENDNDILGLFSPGTQEFDIDEALLANNDNNKEKDNYDDDDVDDMMTLDSVDRIVRGDYLKRNNHRNQGGSSSVTNEAAVNKPISFTSPTTTNTIANVSKQQTAVATTATSTTTTKTAAMTTPVIVNTVKTPNYSTPHNNSNNNDQDEEHEFFYYTPQQQQQDRNDNNWGVMSLSTTSRVSSLAPVWEEAEEEEEKEEGEKEYVHYEDTYDDGTPPFHTPNEYHDYSVERRCGGGGDSGGSRVRWNMMMMVEQRQQDDVIAEEEEEEEEFFSPLGHNHHHHHVVANDVDMTPKHPQHHTPNYHHQQQQQQRQRQVLLENESYKDDTIMEEWKNTNNNLTKVLPAQAISNEMNSSNHQQQQQQQREQQQKQQQNGTSPRLLASSPKYLEMREELQQMLVEAKGLTPRKESTAAAGAVVVVSTAAMESSSSPINERTVSSDITDGEERDDNVQSTMTTAEATRSNNNNNNKSNNNKSNNNKSNVLFSPSSSPSATAQHSFNYSPPTPPTTTTTTTTPNSYHHHHHYNRHHHLHSSSVSSLPPDALTVDFVRQCDDLDTLKAILSLLSDDDDQDDVRNNNYHGGKNVRGGKKLLRYPSLVRYVEKRMKVVVVAASASASATEDEDDELEQHQQQQQCQVVDHAHSSGNEIVRNDGIDKENVNPGGLQHHDHELSYSNQDHNGANDAAFLQGRRSVLLPPPLETISLSQSPGGESNDILEGNEWSIHHHHHRQITPENQSIEERSESMMTHETSLDMNLSESLDDESYFWRQDGGGQQEHEKVQTMTSPAKAVDEQESLDARREHHVDNDVAITPSAPQEEDVVPTTQRESYSELQEKLSSSLAAHAELTERVESLVKEHDIIKDELTSKLNQAREQLSQRQNHASAEKEEYTKQVSQLVKVNQTLEQEMSSLKGRLEAVDQKAVDAATQAEFQLDQSRLIHSKLSKDNEGLGKELDEARQARDKAAAEVMQLKQMLNEQMIATSADSSNTIATKRMQKGLDAAKFANHALANALAISEKDLSEALHQKEKSVRECNALRERIVELEDKSSWLSSKVNEMTRELKSSHAYIDELYAGLQSNNNRSPSKEMKAELERRELQWLELEHQYTRRIHELESQIARQSGSAKVSMADYVVAVRECRKHQSEAAQKQQVVDELESTISSLKHQIETMQRRPSPRNGVSSSMTTKGKSISTMKNYGKKVHNESIMINDENKVPSPEELRAGTMSGEMGGKKTRRISALKAVGGRKGLSEQLRRARRVGGEE